MTLIAGSSGGSLVKETSPGNYYLVGVTHGGLAKSIQHTSDEYPELFVNTQHQENLDFINEWKSRGAQRHDFKTLYPNNDNILYLDPFDCTEGCPGTETFYNCRPRGRGRSSEYFLNCTPIRVSYFTIISNFT